MKPGLWEIYYFDEIPLDNPPLLTRAPLPFLPLEVENKPYFILTRLLVSVREDLCKPSILYGVELVMTFLWSFPNLLYLGVFALVSEAVQGSEYGLGAHEPLKFYRLFSCFSWLGEKVGCWGEGRASVKFSERFCDLSSCKNKH